LDTTCRSRSGDLSGGGSRDVWFERIVMSAPLAAEAVAEQGSGPTPQNEL
jgi:hypothetical protein